MRRIGGCANKKARAMAGWFGLSVNFSPTILFSSVGRFLVKASGKP